MLFSRRHSWPGSDRHFAMLRPAFAFGWDEDPSVCPTERRDGHVTGGQRCGKRTFAPHRDKLGKSCGRRDFARELCGAKARGLRISRQPHQHGPPQHVPPRERRVEAAGEQQNRAWANGSEGRCFCGNEPDPMHVHIPDRGQRLYCVVLSPASCAAHNHERIHVRSRQCVLQRVVCTSGRAIAPACPIAAAMQAITASSTRSGREWTRVRLRRGTRTCACVTPSAESSAIRRASSLSPAWMSVTLSARRPPPAARLLRVSPEQARPLGRRAISGRREAPHHQRWAEASLPTSTRMAIGIEAGA